MAFLKHHLDFKHESRYYQIMKKFLLFLLILGIAGFFLYDPHLKPYLGPYIEPVIAKIRGKAPAAPESPAATLPAGEASTKPVEVANKGDNPPRNDVPPSPPPPAPKETVASTPPAPKPKSEIDKLLEQRYPRPNITPLAVLVNNWQAVPPKAYPPQVTIQEKVAFSVKDGSGRVIGSSVMDKGNVVVPVQLNGTNLIIASPANRQMQSSIPVDQTDFKQRIEATYAKFVADRTNKINQMRELARPRIEQELASGGTGQRAPQDSGDPRFAAVKESLSKGELRAARLDEAVDYHWNGSEQINGETFKGSYDSVTVSFEVHTIFGVFPAEYKCLLRNGKVAGWMDPVTNEEKI